MIKLILLASIIASSSLCAQDKSPGATFVEAEPSDTEPFNPKKNHFIAAVGFEGLKYDVPYMFRGEKQNFSPRGLELWGGRLGLGKEFYLGGGVTATTKVEGYYLGTLFTRDHVYKEQKFDTRKTTGQIFGIDLSQAFGYLFDMKTKNPVMDEWAYLTVEPFIEAGIGTAMAYSRVKYNYQTTVGEGYKHTIDDNLLNARIGAGVNFTSNESYFFFVKATVNKYDVTKRKSEISTRLNNGPWISTSGTDKSVNMDPITIFSLGGGYKF